MSDVIGSKLLAPESLQETVYRLEEARLGFRKSSGVEVEEALDWVLGRQGLRGSYRNLFAPTEKDISEGLQRLTGERYRRRGALTRHVLGEESLRAVVLWNRGSHPSAAKALEAFGEMMDGHQDGFYCCYNCTPAYLRTLSVVNLNKSGEVLDRGIGHIKRRRTPDGKWRGFPFYYTLLTLSGVDTSSAKAELKHAGKTAQKLVKRNEDKVDRASRFRTIGLEAAVNAL